MEQKMIENILNKYVIEAPSMGRSVILADRIDEVADDIRQFLLQQTQCTTLRELLEQMMKDEEQSAAATPSFSKMEKHYANAEDIKNVMKLIKERQPVA